MMTLFMALATSWSLSAAEIRSSCAIPLTELGAARAVFPRGFILRIDRASEAVKAAAKEALQFGREDLFQRFDDRILIPHYAVDTIQPFQISSLRRVGWAMALFEGRTWTHSAFVHESEVHAEPSALQEGAQASLWDALGELNRGRGQKARGLFARPPVFELRLFDAPVQHVHGLWLHGEGEDWFIISHLKGKEILGARHLERLIDAVSLARSKPGYREVDHVPEGM